MNGEPVKYPKITDTKVFQEKVYKVERWCRTLGNKWYLPSGLLTLITMPLIGQAVRHEYILAYTKNFLVLIEVNADHRINFFVYNAETEKKKQ